MSLTTTDREQPGAAAAPASPRVPRTVIKPRRQVTPYLLILPALALLAGLLAYPLYRMFAVSLQDFGRGQLWGTRPTEWIGLDNYTKLFTDATFWGVVRRTAVFTVVSVGLSVLIGLTVALLMRRVSRSVRLAMTVAMMLVWAMPQLVASQVWIWMIDADFGVVNWIIDQLPGVDFAKHSWFADELQGWTIITTVVVWAGVPFLAITLYAGLSQVPRELVEAATVDGANAWHVLRSVILPILRPLIVIVTTLSVIWNFQVFTQIWVLRYGKPELEFQSLGTYAYTQAFGSGYYGLGSAISIVTVLLMLGVMAFYIRQMFKIGDVD